MKKDIIDLVIKYGSCRSLWLYYSSSNGSPLRIQRLDKLTEAYMDKILNATRKMWYKEV